ncbi:MAG: nucleic acid-binding protein contains PIN domain protein [Candidatus Scalindua rubra]|uniref:Nucleic acid-binding protein contains PIN domain protein n=1 Tax=Candidatus Scalindua rubra TaxID=1872076 RepID=A0A1E3XC92_9BACT|nr:MAG: nucleic acid-binding protein contains PIN domain protein [Candidatus Scalindua rubra]
MILVDSSIWVCYYRAEGEEKIKKTIKEAISNDLIAINGIIMVEILSGISRKEEYKKVESDFLGFHILPLDEKAFLDASELGSSLRREGIRVPSTDLIIAASAISYGHILYHMDSHFDLVSKHTKLEAKNYGKKK